MNAILTLESIGGWLLSALAQNFVVTAAMIPLVLVLSRLFRARPAVQHLLWLLVLVKFVTPPLPGLAWRLPDISRAGSFWKEDKAVMEPIAGAVEPVAAPFEPSVVPGRLAPTGGRIPAFAAQDVPEKVAPEPHVSHLPAAKLIFLGLGIAWGLGSVVWMATQFRRIDRRYRLVRRGRTAPDPLAHPVHAAASTMGLKQLPTRIVAGIHSPFLCCLGRVQLAWPESLANADEAAVRLIAAHEAAHLCRRDHWVAWLKLAASAVWWWNPLFWFVQRRLDGAAEMSCDALALAAYPDDRCLYAETLLWLSANLKIGAPPLVLAAGSGAPSSLEMRMSMIISDRVSGKLSGRGFVLAGTLAVAFLPGWSAAQTGQAAASSEGGARSSNLPENAIDDNPFRLPDHWIVEDVRWIEDDEHLISVSLQGGVNVRRWDVASRQLLSEIKLASDQHGRPVRQGTIRLSTDGSRAIAVTDAFVGVWDTSTGELLRQLPIPQKQWEYDTVRCLVSSTDGSVIVAGLGTSYSRTTLVYPSYGIAWDARSGAVLSSFEHETGYDVCDVAVTADGRWYGTCSVGHRIRLWETASGKLLGDYSEFAHDWKSPDPDLIKNNVVRGIDLSPDGQLLAIVGTFGVRLIDITSGKLLRTIDAPVRFGLGDVVFSSDGRYLARFGSRRGDQAPESVLIWSVETGEQLSEFVTPANIARFSHNGRRLAVGESDFHEAVSVWPVSGEKKLGPLPPPKKTLRIDRVEENTHRRGESAAELARRWPLSWGPAQHGLRYGIALTSAGDLFRIGQRVPLVVFLKNTSDQPLQFDFRPDMFGNLPRVTSADGTPVELDRRNLLGQVARYRDKLEPGEVFGPLYLNFGLEKDPRPGTEEWTPHWAAPTPGVYKLTHHAPIHVADPQATGDTSGSDWRQGTLQTGSLEFEIVDARGDNDEAAGQD